MPLFKGMAGKAKPKKAIDYVTDPKKAAIVSSLSMDDSRDYAKQFKETCDMYSKGKGYSERKYYHFKISPDPNDNATPQQCHELAERMAQKLFSAHECVIATHTDTDTMHSHIIVNAVSFETGKKFHMNLWEYRDSKDLADTLGEEMGFTPLDWKTKTSEKLDRIFSDDAITPDKKYLSNAEQQISKRDKQGNASWKEALRQAIDEAKAHSADRAEFQRYLHDNYGVTMPRNTGKTISFVHPAVGEKFTIRGNKLGSDYTASSIYQALQENAERSLINARLFTTQAEQPAATTATIPTPITANAIPNNPTINSQPAIQAGNGERTTPRSISDIGAELRSLDDAVGRIANRVSATSEGDNNDMAEKLHGNKPRPKDPTGGSLRPDRAERPEAPATDKPVQPKPPEPTKTANEPEHRVQQKPKRRVYSHDR